MTGAINDQGWSDDISYFDLSVTWDVTKEKGPDKDPNAEVDVSPWADTLFAAANASDAADLYVNFGSGAKKMNAVAGIAYTTAGGNAATISAANANLIVNGSYVSVPATPALYSGSNWMLILNGGVGGASCRVPFSLKETSSSVLPEPEGDVSPAVNVTKAAGAQNEWAEMTVTLGPMTRVVSMTYVMSNGDESSVNNQAVIKINGTSVQVKAFMGAWTSSEYCRLDMENDDGDVASVCFDLKNTGTITQPVVITTKKATAQNEFAVLKVYMNNMTEIVGLRYRLSNRTYSLVPHTSTPIFPEVTLPEVQVKAFLGVWTGDLPSLEFKNDDGETFSARFAIK